VTDASNDEYWSQYCDIAGSQWSPQPSPTRPNSLFLLLRDVPLPSTDIDNDIELTIRLCRWRNTPHIPLNTSDVLSPRIAPSIASSVLTNESIVNIGTYPKADDFPLWISRDDGALYTIIVRRMVSTLGTDSTIPPEFLDALRWRFEALLVGPAEMDKVACLSTPIRYRDALRKGSLSLRSLHYAFSLLLARNLNSFVGDDRVFRFKEILIMMWASPIGRIPQPTVNVVGMERFFEANKTLIMGWIFGCQDITYIHEILGHLGAAQAEEPKIGPLWRVMPPQVGSKPGMTQALLSFAQLIKRDITPEQHCKLIDLICRDFSLGPPEVFKSYSTDYALRIFSQLEDPCLRLLGQSCAESTGGYFHLSSQDIDGPLKNSWGRIATYFMTHPERTSSPFILGLQGSLWPVIPNCRDLCSKALKEPEVFVSHAVTSTPWLLNVDRIIYGACSITRWHARGITTSKAISSSIYLRSMSVSRFLWI
jgi:hypothetical protein